MKALFWALAAMLCFATTSQAAVANQGLFKGTVTVLADATGVCAKVFRAGDVYATIYKPKVTANDVEMLTLIGADRAFSAQVSSPSGRFVGAGSAKGVGMLSVGPFPSLTFNFNLTRQPAAVTNATLEIFIFGQVTNFLGISGCDTRIRGSAVRALTDYPF